MFRSTRKPLFDLVAVLLVASLCACTSGESGEMPDLSIPNVANIARLQMVVGTATIAEPNNNFEIGLNVVTTFRMPGGNNATLQNTPYLSGPTTFIGDPNPTTNVNLVSGTYPTIFAQQAQSLSHPLLDSLVEFGATVGVFGYGFAGDNTVNPTTYPEVYNALGCTDLGGILPDVGDGGNQPTSPSYNTARSNELALPLFAPRGCGYRGDFRFAPLTASYYGGPPAWPSPQGYNQPAFFRGYPLGFTDFASVPELGEYTLKVQFATDSNYISSAIVTTHAYLPSTVPLPVFPQPVINVQNDGSALITVDVPPGVTEAVINVNTNDCLLIANRPSNHYSLLTRTTGPQVLYLSNNLGPPNPATGQPTHTFCTLADVAAAQPYEPPGTVLPTTGFYGLTAVGFDYPAFEASYPQNMSIAPVIQNATGTADVTTSNPFSGAYNYGTGS
ncbi:MAG TPA: hypothetical protein VEJ41_02055 [Candidatus Acidoferrales bacterium]|nr:hypothetical protein [Candidatus Acidoferrales bacterium]